MTRPMVTAGVSFLTVAFVVSFFSSIIAMLLVTCFILLFIFTFLIENKKMRHSFITVIIAGVIACLSYMNCTAKEFSTDLVKDKNGTFVGVITEIEKKQNGRAQYTLKVKEHNLDDIPKEFTAILYAGYDQDCTFYDKIQVNAKVLSFSKSSTFDSKNFYRIKGVDLILSSYDNIKVLSSNNKPFIYYFKKLNIKLCEITNRYLEKPYAGLIQAILLGNDNDIDDMIYYHSQMSGITHIFVISGLHVSLIAMILFRLLFFFHINKRVSTTISIIFVFFFAMITGFSIPTIRASIMITMILGEHYFMRPADSLSSLFFAGILIVLSSPLAIRNGSFLLSFSATMGVIFLASPIKNFLVVMFHSESKIMNFIASSIGCTISANLFMLPVIIYLFRGISLICIFTNLIVIPLLPFILIFSGLLLIFSFIPIMATTFSYIVKILLDIMITTSSLMAKVPFAYLGLNYKFVYVWLIIFLITVLFTVIFVKSNKVKAYITLLGIVVLGFGIITQYAVNYHKLEITTINTFDGASVVLMYKGNATILSFSDDNYIDIETEKFLRSKNIKRVANYVSCYDNTYYVNDTVYLSKTKQIYNIIMNEEDELSSYADELLNPTNKICYRKNKYAIDLIELERGNKVTFFQKDNKVSILIKMGNTNTIITNDRKTAQNEGTEILYFFQDSNKKIEQFSKEYVIILNKSSQISNQYLKAYENQYTVVIDQNGSFNIRR